MNRILEVISSCFNSIPSEDGRSKIPPFDFVAALVFGLGADFGQRSLVGLRRKIIELTGKSISRSTFWERMATARLKEMLLFLASFLMVSIGKKIGVCQDLLQQLGICGLYILDSTSVTLPKDASKEFPAPRKNVVPAGVKWHALFDFISGTVRWFDLSAASVHDRNGFPPLEMIPKGALIIFDLGYWDYQLLKDLIEHEIYFLTRVKSNAIIHIEQVLNGVPKKFEGHTLMSCCFPANAGHIVDLVGSFQKAGKELFQCRVVGFWNPVDRTYHWYVTNLMVSAKIIYPLYRFRWQCELAFKACKSALNFSNISTSDSAIIQNLVLVGIIHCLISLALGNIASGTLRLEQKLSRSVERAAILFVHTATSIFGFIMNKIDLNEIKNKIKLFTDELYDPNYRSRESSLGRIYAML